MTAKQNGINVKFPYKNIQNYIHGKIHDETLEFKSNLLT